MEATPGPTHCQSIAQPQHHSKARASTRVGAIPGRTNCQFKHTCNIVQWLGLRRRNDIWSINSNVACTIYCTNPMTSHYEKIPMSNSNHSTQLQINSTCNREILPKLQHIHSSHQTHSQILCGINQSRRMRSGCLMGFCSLSITQCDEQLQQANVTLTWLQLLATLRIAEQECKRRRDYLRTYYYYDLGHLYTISLLGSPAQDASVQSTSRRKAYARTA